MKTNVIQTKSFQFALACSDLYKSLLVKNEYVLARQLFKSATSIGANVEEALAAQSRKDFISKMTIASKEARETRYWLKLLNDSHFIDQDLRWYINEIEEINKILAAIIKSSLQSGQ